MASDYIPFMTKKSYCLEKWRGYGKSQSTFPSLHIQQLLKWCHISVFASRITDNMMTSSNENIFRVTGHLCGEFTGPVNSPHKGQCRGALMFSLICVWVNDWVNNREAGDLRRYRAHYDVIVMTRLCSTAVLRLKQINIKTTHQGRVVREI